MAILVACDLMVAGLPLPRGDVSVACLARALQALDPDAKRVVSIAHTEAFGYGSGFIGSAHLLLGLLSVDPEPVTAGVPPDQRAGLTRAIRSQLELLMTAPVHQPGRVVHLPYTLHARAILIDAAARAQYVESASTTPKHLWSALNAAAGSLAARSLMALHRTPTGDNCCSREDVSPTDP